MSLFVARCFATIGAFRSSLLFRSLDGVEVFKTKCRTSSSVNILLRILDSTGRYQKWQKWLDLICYPRMRCTDRLRGLKAASMVAFDR